MRQASRSAARGAIRVAAGSLPARRGHLRPRRAARARSRPPSRCACATSPRAPRVRACASCSARPRTRRRAATSRCTWWCAIRAGARAPPRARPARIRCRRPPQGPLGVGKIPFAAARRDRAARRRQSAAARQAGLARLRARDRSRTCCGCSTGSSAARARSSPWRSRAASCASTSAAPRASRSGNARYRSATALVAPAIPPRLAAARARQPPAARGGFNTLAVCSPLNGMKSSAARSPALAVRSRSASLAAPAARAAVHGVLGPPGPRLRRGLRRVAGDRAERERRRHPDRAAPVGVPILHRLAVDPRRSIESTRVVSCRRHDIRATITSNWTATNNDTGSEPPESLSRLRAAEPDTIMLDGQRASATTRPTSGSRWETDWVILQVPAMLTTRFPCTTPPSRWAPWPTARTLPSRSSTCSTIPRCSGPNPSTTNWGCPSGACPSSRLAIPEPASGLLVLFGLLGIAGGRRKRS